MTGPRAEPGRALRVPTRAEIRDVARLAWPIVVVQVGIMLMGTVDAAMLGRVSPSAMAATALGNFYWLFVIMIGAGTIQALDPIVSQAVGAGDVPTVRHALQRALFLSLLLALISSLLLLPAAWVLRMAGQPADVAEMAGQFARASIPGTLPYLAFIAFRQTMQAFKVLAPIVVTIVVANLANAFFDWVLIFGHLGFAPYGVVGSAWATMMSRWLMALLLLAAGWPVLRPHLRGSWREARRVAPLWDMLRLGVPIGVHQWIEIGAFGGALLLMGLFGTTALAAHQIAITIAALVYMVPLGLAAAAAVLVGHAIGRGDAEGARREASAALVCGVAFMSLSAVLIITAPSLLARAFSDHAEVIAVAVTLLPIAGAFQIFDGVQGVSSGILRGAGDTRVPMLLNLFGFVVVGLPLGAWLAFRGGFGPAGVWWGLLGALVAVAVLLGWRVHVKLGGELRRVGASL